MPPDHLTLSAERLATHVQALLAGNPLTQVATEADIDPADLADAAETYHAAGLAALQRRQEQSWYAVRLTLPNWEEAEKTFAVRVAPRLDQLDNGQAAWWFLRKHPCWRLRVRTNQPDAVTALLDELVAAGAIDQWRPAIYEPESAAFGGSAGMDLIHDLHCVDSRGVLAYAHQHTHQLGRRELSLLLIRALQQHAGLDWFEAGDVFDRVTQIRPAPAPADTPRIDNLAERTRPLLTIPVQADNPLFAPDGPAANAAPWLHGFIRAGRQLGEAATAGRLDRGLRAVLAQFVIFHWNRLGLSANTQGLLAHAAKTAILPRS
ncbi:thiopeptide-type bacteriocin biosynthesis protein [Micromonospora sp. NPDC049523]|uniref:thiopeptide-type bacteriocin biosynthesis protein n=1 Tax=Micromonospora sp. NPDC049523 TaxID=3155921 RepID=UPI00343BB3EE